MFRVGYSLKINLVAYSDSDYQKPPTKRVYWQDPVAELNNLDRRTAF
jgi:hypothetical protein